MNRPMTFSPEELHTLMMAASTATSRWRVRIKELSNATDAHSKRNLKVIEKELADTRAIMKKTGWLS